MNDYSRSFPVLTHDVVTQGHADYCAEHGHASHTVDGVVAAFCPRCGAKINRVDEIAIARAADEQIAAMWDTYWDARKPIVELERQRANELKSQRRSSRPEAFADRIARLGEKIEVATAEARPLAQAARDLDAKLYTGWTRFYLVQHIHNSPHCSSFRPTTQIGWLPDVSGLTEAEAVAEHGAILCTKCFPTAPVELTNGTLKVAADDSTCPGSGQAYDPAQPNTARYHFGPMATCPTCGELVGLKSRGSSLVRKHKRP